MPRNCYHKHICTLLTLILMSFTHEDVLSQQAAQQTSAAAEVPRIKFDIEALTKAPAVFSTDVAAAEGVNEDSSVFEREG